MPNIVTAVLASYRGYDTLGETTVVFTAGAGVVALLRRRRRKGRSGMRHDLVLRVVAKLLIPVHPAVRALRAVPRRLRPRRRLPGRRDHRRGVHLLCHDLRPGGRAQVVPEPLVESMMAIGVLIYAGVGVAGLAARAATSSTIRARSTSRSHGQERGIFWVEVGVGDHGRPASCSRSSTCSPTAAARRA